MIEFLPWVSKKKFILLEKKIAELEEKVKGLDPENVSRNIKDHLGKINEFKERTKQEIDDTIHYLIDEKTKYFSNRLAEQDKKIDDFISLSKRNTIKAIAGSFELIRRTLGITEEELDRIAKEEKKNKKEKEETKG